LKKCKLSLNEAPKADYLFSGTHSTFCST